LELCQFFGTLVGDEETIYDVSRMDDQLVLGIKATISVVELKVLRLRLHQGKENKARRGELYPRLPPGYVWDATDKVVKDPNLRVQEAIGLGRERSRQVPSSAKPDRVRGLGEVDEALFAGMVEAAGKLLASIRGLSLPEDPRACREGGQLLSSVAIIASSSRAEDRCRARTARADGGVGSQALGEGLVRQGSRIPYRMTIERPLLAPSGAVLVGEQGSRVVRAAAGAGAGSAR